MPCDEADGSASFCTSCIASCALQSRYMTVMDEIRIIVSSDAGSQWD